LKVATCARLMAIVVLATGLAGCSHMRNCAPSGCAPASELPAIERGNVEAGIRALPTRVAGATEPARSYRAMTPGQCLCLAVAAAPAAQLQQQEIQLASARSAPSPAGSDCLTALRRDVLLYSSLEIQNQMAGSALEAFYHLAEAEGKADLLAQSLTELGNAQRETQQMVSRGLKPPVTADVWARQVLSAQGDAIQAQITIGKLNADLRGLTGLRDATDWRIWNPDAYQVTDTPVDVDAAIAEGLSSRPELLLLRRLIQDSSPATMSLVREVLKSIHPLLGLTARPVVHVLTQALAIAGVEPAGGIEADTRRRQLSQYLCDREAAVADEIRQAAAAVRYRTQIVALASARERSWADKTNEVRSRQQQGLASFAEVASTNLDWLKARADVIQEVMAWHIAWVKLRQAQGLLPADCASSGHCR
jgi:hypothetical protein